VEKSVSVTGETDRLGRNSFVAKFHNRNHTLSVNSFLQIIVRKVPWPQRAHSMVQDLWVRPATLSLLKGQAGQIFRVISRSARSWRSRCFD